MTRLRCRLCSATTTTINLNLNLNLNLPLRTRGEFIERLTVLLIVYLCYYQI